MGQSVLSKEVGEGDAGDAILSRRGIRGSIDAWLYEAIAGVGKRGKQGMKSQNPKQIPRK